MSLETAVDCQLLKASVEKDHRRPRLWPWALVCFVLIPLAGLLLTMLTSFQYMEGPERVVSPVDRVLLNSWIVFPVIGVGVFVYRLRCALQADEPEASGAGELEG